MSFKIFYYNSQHDIYNPDYFLTKLCKKVQDVGFLSKAITIYFGTKAGFDCKNNHW